MIKKVPSSSRWPSEPSRLGSLKYFVGSLNPLIEIKILGGMKKKISVMVRHSGLGICKRLGYFEKRNTSTLNS